MYYIVCTYLSTNVEVSLAVHNQVMNEVTIFGHQVLNISFGAIFSGKGQDSLHTFGRFLLKQIFILVSASKVQPSGILVPMQKTPLLPKGPEGSDT